MKDESQVRLTAQGSGRVLFKITDQVFIHFPPQFQALVLHCALVGSANTLLVLHQGLFSLGCFSPDQSGRFKLQHVWGGGRQPPVSERL